LKRLKELGGAAYAVSHGATAVPPLVGQAVQTAQAALDKLLETAKRAPATVLTSNSVALVQNGGAGSLIGHPDVA